MKLLNLMWSQSFMGLVNTRHSIYWDRMIPHFGNGNVQSFWLSKTLTISSLIFIICLIVESIDKMANIQISPKRAFLSQNLTYEILPRKLKRVKKHVIRRTTGKQFISHYFHSMDSKQWQHPWTASSGSNSAFKWMSLLGGQRTCTMSFFWYAFALALDWSDRQNHLHCQHGSPSVTTLWHYLQPGNIEGSV